MSVLVQQRWPEELRARVDEVAGPRGRSAFTVAALEKALEVLGAPSGPVTAGSARTVPAPSRASLRANYGALGEGLAPGPSEVVERLERAQERSQKPNRFACGCATSATSHKARCPRHNRALI